MADSADLQHSAEAISLEIGLDLSYFTEESERNFLPLALPIGYLLLQWFIEGLIAGAGAAAGETLAKKAATGVKRLGVRVRRLFGGSETTPEAGAVVEKELATEAKAALTRARGELGASSADEVTLVAEVYEQALVGYLTDNGMPGADAVRIAQRVRSEAGIQLRLPPKEGPGFVQGR